MMSLSYSFQASATIGDDQKMFYAPHVFVANKILVTFDTDVEHEQHC